MFDPARLLSDWPSDWSFRDAPAFSAPLLAAMHQVGRGRPGVGQADIVSSARQALLGHYGESAYSRVFDVSPRTPVSREFWDEAFEVTASGHGGLAVKPRRWSPAWLAPDGADPTEHLWQPVRRRETREVPADPFYTQLLGYPTYVDDAQRSALYSVLLAKTGSTRVVVLPTGSGKTSVALAPALLRAQKHGGTAIFVVPTVTLAQDLEGRVHKILASAVPDLARDHEFAYLGDQDDVSRERIRRRLTEGTQVILFTNPESLVNSLRPALYAAAAKGAIAVVVIDEAHLIADWGTNFRPALQTLAGVRRGLLHATASSGHPSFMTLLMTGTMTQEHMRTVVAHFSDEEPIQLSASVVLRPEPSYWFSECESERVRHQRLRELSTYLPRPLVIYTSTRSSARHVFDAMRSFGHERVGLVTGATTSAERGRVLAGLTPEHESSEFDMVVATSAFGLGVDRHLRCVVHACIPESVDRFYQEVGRSGRDGCASFSLVLFTKEDHRVARRLSEQKVITTKRARERWLTMVTKAETVRGRPGLLRVRLPVKPVDLIWRSKLNAEWNTRVLNLMARARYLRLEDEPPDWEADDVGRSQVVRMLRNDLSDPKAWTAFEEVRRQARESEEANYDRVLKILAGHEVAEVFARSYSIPADHDSPHAVHAQLSCGGCPADRLAGTPPYEGLAPTAPLDGVSVTPGLADLQARFGAPLVITYIDPPNAVAQGMWVRDCADLARALVLRGMRVLILPEVLAVNALFQRLHTVSDGGFVIFGSLADAQRLSEIPTAIFLTKADAPQYVARIFQVSAATPSLVVLPAGTPDPAYRGRTIETVRAPVHDLRSFLGRL